MSSEACGKEKSQALGTWRLERFLGAPVFGSGVRLTEHETPNQGTLKLPRPSNLQALECTVSGLRVGFLPKSSRCGPSRTFLFSGRRHRKRNDLLGPEKGCVLREVVSLKVGIWVSTTARTKGSSNWCSNGVLLRVSGCTCSFSACSAAVLHRCHRSQTTSHDLKDLVSPTTCLPVCRLLHHAYVQHRMFGPSNSTTNALGSLWDFHEGTLASAISGEKKETGSPKGMKLSSIGS